jgi:hypothetical protein
VRSPPQLVVENASWRIEGPTSKRRRFKVYDLDKGPCPAVQAMGLMGISVDQYSLVNVGPPPGVGSSR